MRPLLLLMLLAVGCPRTEKLADIPVGSATLDQLNLEAFEMFGGGEIGTAELHIVEPDGTTTHDVSVGASGGMVGPMMDIKLVGVAQSGVANLDVSVVTDPHGDDLLGPYDGFLAEGGMLVGGYWHDLENDRHVGLTIGGGEIEIAFSLILAEEWLTLDIGTEGRCHDGADDDADGLVDCADPDCAQDVGCAGAAPPDAGPA